MIQQGDSMSQQRQQALITSVPEAHGNNYEVWAEIIPCTIPADTVCLRFSTAWSGARDPSARQIKGEYFLDNAGREQLLALLTGVTAP
jgi:hypothetical protein